MFTGFVPAQSVAAVGGQKFLESLSGNPITVTGKIDLYKGRPEIVISSSAQIVKSLSTSFSPSPMALNFTPPR